MHPSSGISAFAYRSLRRHLGLDCAKIDVYGVVQMLDTAYEQSFESSRV